MPLFAENSNDRIMIFIDLRNVLKSTEAMKNAGIKLDFYHLALQLTGTRQLVGAYVFDSKKPYGSDDPSHRLHDKLRYDGFRIIARESYDEKRQEQKEVDVALACEVVSHAFRDNYDVGIVVSGDRDFVPAIQHAQAFGKRIEVAAFSNSVSPEIRRRADRFHSLDTYPLMQMNDAHVEEMVE
ncbi:MAG: hypothetical protein CVT48_02945 [Thermoplasmata archaeon HGW-Thermoplasmata-1]|nr:MAG: hypothetical protein CVT48_02945 [Thermoplasmata archaeon HGW-Thermoplasmata-1]